jgi:hypothetical protein
MVRRSLDVFPQLTDEPLEDFLVIVEMKVKGCSPVAETDNILIKRVNEFAEDTQKIHHEPGETFSTKILF